MSAVCSAARTRAMSAGTRAFSSSASARLRSSLPRCSSFSSECSPRPAKASIGPTSSSLVLHDALRVLDHILALAGQHEGLLRQLVVLSLQELSCAADRSLALHVLPAPASQLRRDERGLAHIPLESS